MHHAARMSHTDTDCKRPRTEQQQGAQYKDFTVLTHNLMGMTTVLEDTALTVSEHTPDVMVYTETKLTEESRNQLDKHLMTYKLYHSCKATNRTSKSGKERSRAGSAGVTIAVHTDLLTQHSVSLIRIQNPIAKGHCKAVKIQPPGSDCIIVWGVYVPHDTTERRQVYDMLREEVPKATAQARSSGCKCVSIMAGDWNAALLEGDKATLDGQDTAHQELMSELHMQPTQSNLHHHRPATHHPVADDTPASRIDDILMSHDLVPNTFPRTEVICGTGDSDHSALLARIPLEKVLLLKPGPDKSALPTRQKLKTPVAAAQLAAFKETFAIETAELTHDLNADLDMLLELADEIRADDPECTDVKALLAEHGIDSVTTEGKAEKLQAIMSVAELIAHNTCDYTNPSSDTHKRHQPRSIARQTRKDNRYRRALNKALQEYKLKKGADIPGWQDQMRDVLAKTISSLSADSQQAFPPAPETDDAYEWSAWKKDCKGQQKNRKNRAKKARVKAKKKLFAKAKLRVQTQYNTQPKQIHNMIFGKMAGKAKLTAVVDHKTGNVLNKPEEVIQQVHEHFQNQANPAFGPKTGEFLPTEVNRNYPWAEESHSKLDPYTIEIKVGKPLYGKVSILDHIRCPSMFSARVRGLSNNKQPGPDGIPNELIKHLPDELHQAIHKLFVLMWMTGTTPQSWKESTTILLHKKGSELDLNNYRPIALANTLYKLWTGVVQECMSKYAEHYDILSSQQEGFRKKRNTIRQLQNLMNVMSDAKISNNDIYMLSLN